NHELSNPLMGAAGSLDLLKRYFDQMTRSECVLFIEQALRSCDDMERIVSNVKVALRTGDDVPKPQCEPFRLDLIVQTFLRYLYTFGHPLITVHIQESLWVSADAQQVQQVLRNLLHNAFKYAPSEMPVSVQVGAWDE